MQKEPRASIGAFAKEALFALLSIAVAVLVPAAAEAHRHHHIASRGRGVSFVGLTDPSKDAALIVDGETGRTLYARNADSERHPASLTKMMTLYLLFDALKHGKVTMNTPLAISQHAAGQKPTNLHLWAGDQISVETAIKAIVVRSANDVAVAIAEGLGGTESHFAELMTEQARLLGMRATHYHNASGLPDPLQITTASDLALLAHHLAYDFPQYFGYFATPSFYFRGVTYPTHDNLIGRYEGADGIKTGYTQASGFNLVSSVVRGGAHVIAVVMGGRTAHMRDREMVRLLDQTFTQINSNPSLVAHADVPWHAPMMLAQNAASLPPPSTVITLPPSAASAEPAVPGEVAALPPPSTALLPAPTDDEEAAEAKTNEGNADLVTRSVVQPLPKPTAPAPQIGAATNAQMLAVKPQLKPAPRPAPAAPIVVAANHPNVVPTAKPVVHQEFGEGDISYEKNRPTAATMGPSDWTIQIGAFANQALARAQLAAYAEKSMDVLGQAARIVAPFQSTDGHTMYRARFGPFPEREAREVCTRLTQRGQTCFAAIATR